MVELFPGGQRLLGQVPMSQDAYSAQTPRPISVPAETWQLGASPGELEAIADVLRSIGTAADSAQQTVRAAVSQVAGSWEGDTAEAYREHEAALRRDLQDFAEASSPPARAMEGVAAVLRRGQEMLDDEWHRLAPVRRFAIPSIPPFLAGTIMFLPRDEGEASAVQQAVAAAEDIRGWVDHELAGSVVEFGRAQRAFETIAEARQPREVTHLNLNAGMGRREDSTKRDDLDELADAIASGDADVVTLQEVLHNNLYDDGDSPGLLSLLEERTGESWTVAALSDPHYTAPGGWGQYEDPDNPDRQAYGNAVLVREGDVVAAPEGSRTRPDTPADVGDQIDLHSSRVTEHYAEQYGDTPEDRAAAVAELEIRDR